MFRYKHLESKSIVQEHIDDLDPSMVLLLALWYRGEFQQILHRLDHPEVDKLMDFIVITFEL